MDGHETTATYDLAETCCASISIEDLTRFTETDPCSLFDTAKKLMDGSIRGSERLRKNIALQYPSVDGKALSEENVIVTPGAIQANFQVSFTLVGPGDHVICQYPTLSATLRGSPEFGSRS